MVFYRKYRPQKIDDLDSQEVRDTLSSIFLGKTIPHAFLFTGPKGLGKTSTARIIAKILNCEKINDYSVKKSAKKATVKKEIKNKKIEPCNKCSQCLSITSGSSMDILEIDGASNRGIDEIRDLREKIKLSPAASLKKVYIIDEVHMLTTEAFNALLKTLEEPPSHAVFILCTTEQHKVPDTIASRCFRIAFKRATKDELLRSFKRIAALEKIAIDNDALLAIASLSDGSFRDGVKVLEEIISIAGNKKITKDLLEKRYQILTTDQKITDLLKLLEEKSSKDALDLVGKLIKEGVEIRYFFERLIDKLHDELLIKAGVLEGKEITKFSIDKLVNLIEILVKANLEIKFAVLPQLPLEISILKLCKDSNQDKSILDKADEKVAFKKDELEKNEKEEDLLKDLIEKIKPYNHSIAGLLRGCRLVKIESGKVAIETGYKFHKEKLDEIKTKEKIEEVINELTGKDLKLITILKEKRG